MKLFFAYLSGIIFGIGISISGMVNPAKVLNFFDVAGAWDPRLAFVMGGALIITFIGYRFVLKHPAPFMATGFQLPARKDFDLPLIGGSAVFGIGWGTAGFCPGAALPALGTGRSEGLIFVATLLVGIIAAKILQSMLSNRATAQA